MNPTDTQNALPPSIPDHELLRLIGRGGYGEVWLARNTSMGVYRAVKVVRRRAFEQDKPYDREFGGLQKFEPVSRSHEGLMDVLHVGGDDTAGFFYAVMELADDRVTGQQIDPAAYVPKTLRSEIRKRGRLPFEESLPLGVSLTSALGHLHKQGLVHRDIKPSNIIFVSGVPKLADIGLVTDLDATCSFVGTEGYVPPEGPGSPQADLFALGKVLYEISTGMDRSDYPELPTGLKDFPDSRGLLELNEVIVKACEPTPAARYRSADAMQADLILIQKGHSLRRKHRSEQRQRLAKRVGATVAAILGIAFVGYCVAQLTRGSDGPILSAIPIAAPRVQHSEAGVVVFNGEVYIFSGYSGTNSRTRMTEIYNPKSNAWSQGADFPSARDWLAAFELNGLVYAVGGEGPISEEFSQTVFRYDPKARRWSRLNDFPMKSWGAMAAVCKGKAYVMGGRRGYGATCGDVYEYNPTADVWILRAPMPVPVRNAGVAVYGDKVYVFGGIFQASEEQFHNTNTMQIFDPVANSWITKSMPILLQAPVAAVPRANAVYVLSKNVWSDKDSTWLESTSVWHYSPETEQWTEVELKTPALASLMQLPACIEDTLYLLDADPHTRRAWKLRLPAN